MIDLHSNEYKCNPYPSFARLREHIGPYWDEVSSSWYVAHFEDVHRLLVSPLMTGKCLLESPSRQRSVVVPVEEFYSRWPVFNDRPEHDIIRQELSKHFTVSSIRQLNRQVREWTVEQAEVFRRSSRDLVNDFALPLAVRWMELLMGVTGDRTLELLELSKRLIDYLITPKYYLEAAPDAFEAINYLNDVVLDELLDESASGLATGPLARIASEGRVDRIAISAAFSQFLTGSIEPTTTVLTAALYHVSRDDRTVSALAEGTLPVESVTQEVLRYDPPFHRAPRSAAEEFTLGGETIVAGDRVVLLLAAGNRDAKRWENADSFDPTRPYLPNLSFARGSHSCLGAAIVRLQMNTALAVASEQKLFDLVTGDLERLPGLGATRFRHTP